MKKIFLITLFALIGFSVSNLQAQNRQYYSLGWDVGFPMGEFSDFISDASLRGGFFSGNVFVTNSLSVGFKFGYNAYYENKDRQTYYLEPGLAVTAAKYNYIMNAPLQVGPYYHFNVGGAIEPYIGLGLGVNYIYEETVIQDVEDYNYQWSFLMSPEAGVRIPFSKTSPVALGIRVAYNVNFNSFTSMDVEYNNFQSLNLGLSLSYTIR